MLYIFKALIVGRGERSRSTAGIKTAFLFRRSRCGLVQPSRFLADISDRVTVPKADDGKSSSAVLVAGSHDG